MSFLKINAQSFSTEQKIRIINKNSESRLKDYFKIFLQHMTLKVELLEQKIYCVYGKSLI